jgi:hypothetical protein
LESPGYQCRPQWQLVSSAIEWFPGLVGNTGKKGYVVDVKNNAETSVTNNLGHVNHVYKGSMLCRPQLLNQSGMKIALHIQQTSYILDWLAVTMILRLVI